MPRLLDDNGIRAILFDSYGTIFDDASVVELCEQRHPPDGRELALLWRRKQLEYTWLLSIMQRYEDFSRITELALLFAAKAFDVSLSSEQKDSLLHAYLELEHFTEAALALQELSSYRLAIVSNGTSAMLRALLERNALAAAFDTLISADEVKAYKPDPRIYRLAANKLDISPERLLLVSAHSFDVNGAKSSGMLACWVNRNAGQWDSLGFLPDMTVGDLRELVEILNA